MKISDFILLHVKVIIKSDNWKSVENITLENFRFHTFACKSDN